jgi:hypothetical protein
MPDGVSADHCCNQHGDQGAGPCFSAHRAVHTVAASAGDGVVATLTPATYAIASAITRPRNQRSKLTGRLLLIVLGIDVSVPS